VSTYWSPLRPPAMSRLSPRVYLGRFADGRDWRAGGVDAVCNLTQDDHDPRPTHYLWLRQEDSAEIPSWKIAEFLRWMRQQYLAGRTVLIHCHAGISRTSAFAVFWMMWQDRVPADGDLASAWSAREDHVRRCRDCIEPHWKLKQSLLQFYRKHGPREAA
jgi:hypothetical protein